MIFQQFVKCYILMSNEQEMKKDNLEDELSEEQNIVEDAKHKVI